MKSKSQTVLRGGQHSKRMAHILLVEKPLMKGHFITTLGGHSSLKPHHLPIPHLHIRMAARFSETHYHDQRSSLCNTAKETHSFWRSLQEALDPETRPSESPASGKQTHTCNQPLNPDIGTKRFLDYVTIFIEHHHQCFQFQSNQKEIKHILRSQRQINS